jgi:hypothetical protein
MQKVGVTNLPPIKRISPLRLGQARKDLLVTSSEFFVLLGSFIFGVVALLNLAHHLDDLAASHSLYSIQNFHLSLVIC